jgi:hypothetical protein
VSVPRRERLQLLLVAPMECVGDVVERLLHVRPLDGGDLEEIHVMRPGETLSHSRRDHLPSGEVRLVADQYRHHVLPLLPAHLEPLGALVEGLLVRDVIDNDTDAGVLQDAAGGGVEGAAGGFGAVLDVLVDQPEIDALPAHVKDVEFDDDVGVLDRHLLDAQLHPLGHEVVLGERRPIAMEHLDERRLPDGGLPHDCDFASQHHHGNGGCRKKIFA